MASTGKASGHAHRASAVYNARLASGWKSRSPAPARWPSSEAGKPPRKKARSITCEELAKDQFLLTASLQAKARTDPGHSVKSKLWRLRAREEGRGSGEKLECSVVGDGTPGKDGGAQRRSMEAQWRGQRNALGQACVCVCVLGGAH